MILRITLQLLSPTVIAQRPTSPGQVTRSPEYLSGTVLRGGIAGLWRDQRSADDEEHFQAIFVDGQLRFGNAWPFQPKCRTWIVPKSAAHKKRGGWLDLGDSGVADLLTRLLREAEPDDMEPVDAAFVSADDSTGTWKPLDVSRRLISRTAIQPALAGGDRGVAAAGQLYSFEALETGEQFQATISGPEALLQELEDLLKPQPILRIGQGRSRGLGQVQVTRATPAEPEPPGDERAEVIARFSALAHAEAGTRLLPITLESDTILRDNYLLACSSADPGEVLQRYLPGVPASLQLVYANQSTRWIGGWEQIRRLPRPPELAVTQGSVWVFTVSEPELPAALAWWDEVAESGLGERCAEGFGQVRLLHPFHQVEEDYLW